MYILDFFRRTFRRANVPMIIYLVLNLIIMVGVLYALLAGAGVHWAIAVLLALVLYFGSASLALSPVGEGLLRRLAGCRQLEASAELNYFMPVFDEVYARARDLDPGISSEILPYICDDSYPYVFALGRNTLVISRGMMNLEQELVASAMAHEFGHFSHHDPDMILMISVGNLLVTAVIAIYRLLVMLFVFLFRQIGKRGASWAVRAADFLSLSAKNFLLWLWTKIGVFFCIRSSGDREYDADAFAMEIGFGGALCTRLEMLDAWNLPKSRNLFAGLIESHPGTAGRIDALQAMYGEDGPFFEHVPVPPAPAAQPVREVHDQPEEQPQPEELEQPEEPLQPEEMAPAQEAAHSVLASARAGAESVRRRISGLWKKKEEELEEPMPVEEHEPVRTARWEPRGGVPAVQQEEKPKERYELRMPRFDLSGALNEQEKGE